MNAGTFSSSKLALDSLRVLDVTFCPFLGLRVWNVYEKKWQNNALTRDMKGGNEALHPYIHLSSDCSKNDRPFFFYDLGPFKGRRRILHSMPYVKKIHFSSCCCNNKGSSTLVPPFLHSSNKRQARKGLKHLHKMHAFKKSLFYSPFNI